MQSVNFTVLSFLKYLSHGKAQNKENTILFISCGGFFLPMPGSVMTWGNKKFKGKRENKVENASLWDMKQKPQTIYYNPLKLYSLY